MSSPDLPPVTVQRPPRKPLFARCLEYWRNLSGDQRRRLRGFVVYASVLTLIFLRQLVSLMAYTSGTELHSHIILVPFVSAYLLYINRHHLPPVLETSRGWGAALLATGLALACCGWIWEGFAGPLSLNDQFAFPVLSFISLLAAGGFYFLGKRWMTVAAFPAAFLLFMVPLPDAVVNGLETASQHASAEAASWYFRLAGVPFFRYETDGTIFQLPGIGPIKVAQECSGIRSSWVLIITSLIAAHMFLKGPWRRALFVALVIPLGILRNGFRILVIGWLCVEVSPDMMNHWIHHRGGPVFFALSLVPLFLILWWLRRGELRQVRKQSGGGVPKAKGEVTPV